MREGAGRKQARGPGLQPAVPSQRRESWTGSGILRGQEGTGASQVSAEAAAAL